MARNRRRLLLLLMALALVAVPAAAASGAGGFQGPIFGMDTADNGRLLVADASTGIIGVSGNRMQTMVDLPGATAVASIDRHSMWVTTGAGESPQADTGQALYKIVNGEARHVVNLFEFESTSNPDGNDPFDSNPYDVASLGPNAALVVDAGGNSLLHVNARGDVKVLAVFPDSLASTDNLKSVAGCPDPVPELAFACDLPPQMPAQSVPTSVAIGPDGYYYVGELRGFPGPANESSIWRVSPRPGSVTCPSVDCMKVFDGGFTSIVDLDFGPDGNLYVAELDEASWTAVEITMSPTGGTIDSCDLDTLVCSEVATDIPILTAITFDARGHLWASRNALIPGLAEVYQVD